MKYISIESLGASDKWDISVKPCQVVGISETRDQNYHSNAQPRFRLADLLTEVVILQLRRGSKR